MSARRLLLVDDDETFRARLARALVARGLEVETAADPAAALAAARRAPPAYAVVDLKMPGGSGLELVRALVGLAPAARVVVLTGYGSIASAVEALRRGAHHYLSKPADADEIIAALEGDRAAAAPDEQARAGDAPSPTLARAEWEHLSRILADCGGNVSEAARRLGITRRTLQLKLKKNPPTR
ncbi:MAG TPA: response regulator [Polyangia bacterium]|nr:response regulator [Polyangia bacterium]